MGLYINPQDMSKEEWLLENAIKLPDRSTRLSSSPLPLPEDPALALVCYVVNGRMTAAGVCLDEAERQAFNQPTDERPKAWFHVPRAELRKLPGLESV